MKIVEEPHQVGLAMTSHGNLRPRHRSLANQCWKAALDHCKYDEDGSDMEADDDENKILLSGEACSRCVLTRMPNKCERYVRTRPKFAKRFCDHLEEAGGGDDDLGAGGGNFA